MNNEQLAGKIIELVGGKDNIASAQNCMTRVRLQLKDSSQVDIDGLKNTEGVLGVVEQETLQVVVGPGKAKKVTDALIEIAQLSEKDALGEENDWKKNKNQLKTKQKQSSVKTAIAKIANIFIPMIPAIIASGLLKGIGDILSQTSTGTLAIAEKSGTMFIVITALKLMSGAFLSYFAIFTGVNAAKEFGATPAIGGMIGAMSIMTDINTLSAAFGWYDAETPLNSMLLAGKGGIIGVIFGVWLLSKVEKMLRKVIPDVLDLVITPFFAIIITTVAFVFVVMPVAGFVSDVIVLQLLNTLISSTNPIISVISGYILSAVFLPLVLLGLHHGLVPIYAIQLETLGSVSLFPVLAMAGAGQVGAAVAIYFKAKRVNNHRIKKVIAGALPAGFLGVGEPLIYGVTLPLGKPFITAGLGAGVGGAFVQLMHVTSVAWGPSGLVAIPLMSSVPNMLFYTIGLFVSYLFGCIITYAAIKDEAVRQI